jgi:5-formyltetrahydrofolate cyclo-ligase
MSDISYDKARIRAQIREQRKLLGEEELKRADADLEAEFELALKQDIFLKNRFEKAETVAVYAAFGGELPCDALAEFCRKNKKKTVYPVTDGDDMYFCEVKDPSKELHKGRFGIMEPSSKAVPNDSVDIVIMPGIAYDEEGGRVGMGGGFYDRWISSFDEDQRPLLIGVCMQFQMMTKVPCEASDIFADVVLCV